MPELRDRFESLSRTRAPDLWLDVEHREPRSDVEPRTRPVLAATVALLVAAAGIGFAAMTFGGSQDRRVPSAPNGVIANGQILYRVGGKGGTAWHSVMQDGSEQRVLFEGESMRIAQIAWSPDGTKIAYQNPIVDERGIFVANADGSGAVRLTEGWNDGWPSWSPDGSRIVFTRTAVDPGDDRCIPGTPHDFRCPTDIYVMDADGSNVVRLTDDLAGEFMPVWSPDGSRIAFAREGDPVAGTYEAIFTMDPDGTDVRQVSSSDGGSDFWPSWSPDGSQIAFAAIRREDWGIWIVDANGEHERMVLGGTGAGHVDNPVWSPDGELIAFVGNLSVDDYSPDDALHVMRPDGTGVTPIADAPGTGVAGDIAWQPLPAKAETQPLPTTASVVDTFEVGEDVRSVVFGEGSVWVAASNNDGSFGGRILRIDPETHETLAEISIDAIPTWEVGGGAMVFADGDLWVAGDLEGPGSFEDPGGGADAAVARLDTSTNEVVQTFALGGTGAADLTFLDGELWVLVFGDETVDHAMEVVRVDPTDGDVLARIPLTSSWAHSIVASEGRLVVLEGGRQAVNVDGRVAVIDPATGAVSRAEIPSQAFTPMPVMWRGEVWVSLDPGFVRFDPVAAGFPDPAVELPAAFSGCCGFLESDDAGVWFIISLDQERAGERRLVLFDPSSGEIVELADLAGVNPVAMAVAPGSVWILNYEGTLTHVDLG